VPLTGSRLFTAVAGRHRHRAGSRSGRAAGVSADARPATALGRKQSPRRRTDECVRREPIRPVSRSSGLDLRVRVAPRRHGRRRQSADARLAPRQLGRRVTGARDETQSAMAGATSSQACLAAPISRFAQDPVRPISFFGSVGLFQACLPDRGKAGTDPGDRAIPNSHPQKRRRGRCSSRDYHSGL
jgi:hypothetical protein